MKVSRPNTRGALSDKRGFTLPEVLITIVIVGILASIAIPSWRAVVEGRQVESATNQLVSDRRLVNSRSTNRLTGYQVVLTNGSSTYQFGSAGSLASRTLANHVKVNTSLTTLEFKPNGSVTETTDAANEIEISKTSPTTDPEHGISINPATSRVKVD